MHNSYFTGRIYVEKTFKQCYFGYHNSQRSREGGYWDKYSSKGSDDQQVEGEDSSKEDI